MTAGTSARLDAPQMCQAFDEAFTRPLGAGVDGKEDFLIVRIGGRPHAVPLDDVAAMQRAGPMTPVPGTVPELLGLATHHGEILPVYDLAAILGEAGGSGGASWHLATRHAPLILAVGGFDRHIRCHPDGVAPGPVAPAGTAAHIAARLLAEGSQYPVVSLASVIATIQRKAQAASQET